MAGVVEEVVEQDLAGEHRKERQERGGDRGAEHVAEVRRGAHEDILDGVGERAVLRRLRRPALRDPFEQNDVGGVFGDVRGGVDRDPDVGRVERDSVVDAITKEHDVAVGGTVRADEAGLLFGADRAKIVVSMTRARSASSSSAAMLVPVIVAPISRPRSRQTFSATTALSPVTTLTVMPSVASRSRDAAASSLGWSKNTRNRRGEIVFVAGVRGVGAAGGSGRDRDDAPPAENSVSRVGRADSVTSQQAARTDSGAPW